MIKFINNDRESLEKAHRHNYQVGRKRQFMKAFSLDGYFFNEYMACLYAATERKKKMAQK